MLGSRSGCIKCQVTCNDCERVSVVKLRFCYNIKPSFNFKNGIGCMYCKSQNIDIHLKFNLICCRFTLPCCMKRREVYKSQNNEGSSNEHSVDSNHIYKTTLKWSNKIRPNNTNSVKHSQPPEVSHPLLVGITEQNRMIQ